MIRYTCPRCKKSLESPASFAGQKLNCPDCNRRLQLPRPSASPPQPLNKTILAAEEAPQAAAPPPAARAPRPPLPPPPAPAALYKAVELIPDVLEVAGDGSPRTDSPPARGREYCLECGVDVTQQSRVQSCPDCGSLLCSARCSREHRYHAHPPKHQSRPRYVECRYCGSPERPYYTTVITDGGWITFAVLLLLFFPLCWIGLLMTETRA